MPKLVFRVASDWEEVVKLRNEIAKLLRLRAMFFMQVHMLPGYSAASLVRTMTDLVEVDEYIMNPLNMDLYMESDFYVEEDDSLADMESILYGTYQYSIFGDARHKLFTLKLSDEISSNGGRSIAYLSCIFQKS